MPDSCRDVFATKKVNSQFWDFSNYIPVYSVDIALLTFFFHTFNLQTCFWEAILTINCPPTLTVILIVNCQQLIRDEGACEKDLVEFTSLYIFILKFNTSSTQMSSMLLCVVSNILILIRVIYCHLSMVFFQI